MVGHVEVNNIYIVKGENILGGRVSLDFNRFKGLFVILDR